MMRRLRVQLRFLLLALIDAVAVAALLAFATVVGLWAWDELHHEGRCVGLRGAAWPHVMPETHEQSARFQAATGWARPTLIK